MLPRVHGFEHALSRWVHEVLPHVEAVEVVAIEILVRDDLHRRNRGIGNDVAYALARTDVGTFLIQFDGELHVGWATAERVVLLEPLLVLVQRLRDTLRHDHVFELELVLEYSLAPLSDERGVLFLVEVLVKEFAHNLVLELSSKTQGIAALVLEPLYLRLRISSRILTFVVSERCRVAFLAHHDHAPKLLLI